VWQLHVTTITRCHNVIERVRDSPTHTRACVASLFLRLLGEQAQLPPVQIARSGSMTTAPVLPAIVNDAVDTTGEEMGTEAHRQGSDMQADNGVEGELSAVASVVVTST
jgi:hypothetical protein